MEDPLPLDGVSDSLQSRLRSLPLFARELLAGGLAGGLAKTSVAPLERTKILFQTGRISSTSVPQAVLMLYQTEGIIGLFRGNGASVMRIVPYAAIHFSTYEYYRRFLLDKLASRWNVDLKRVNPAWDLVAGSLSGATAVMCTYPLDFVRTRLAYSTESALQSTGTTRHTIRSVLLGTFRQEGVVGLYRGVAPTLLGIMPYAGLKFYVYQSLKAWYRGTAQPNTPTEGRGKGRLPVPMMLLFGAISGLAGQTVTYPLDLVRRRMQVAGLRHTAAPPGAVSATPAAARATTWGTVAVIFREGGGRALFRGLSINYMKVVPSTAIGFTVYDGLKMYLGVQGNL